LNFLDFFPMKSYEICSIMDAYKCKRVLKRWKKYATSLLAAGTFLGAVLPGEVAGHGWEWRSYGAPYPPPPPPPMPWEAIPFCPPVYGWPDYSWPPPPKAYVQPPKKRISRTKPSKKRFYGRKPSKPSPAPGRSYAEESPLAPYGYFDERGVWIPFSRPRDP